MYEPLGEGEIISCSMPRHNVFVDKEYMANAKVQLFTETGWDFHMLNLNGQRLIELRKDKIALIQTIIFEKNENWHKYCLKDYEFGLFARKFCKTYAHTLIDKSTKDTPLDGRHWINAYAGTFWSNKLGYTEVKSKLWATMVIPQKNTQVRTNNKLKPLLIQVFLHFFLIVTFM